MAKQIIYRWIWGLDTYSPTPPLKERSQDRLYNASISGEIGKIFDIMYHHFDTIPHDCYKANDIEKDEVYYCSIFYSYFASIRVDVRVEEAINKGKIDMAVVMKDKVIIFELKVVDIVKDGKTALAVLKERGYADGYKYLNLPIYLVWGWVLAKKSKTSSILNLSKYKKYFKLLKRLKQFT